uniref:Uncharacterized protein n=1 Tax=Arundo donax TaxID=35708 RepID=A0A0A9E8M9_ARUDO
MAKPDAPAASLESSWPAYAPPLFACGMSHRCTWTPVTSLLDRRRGASWHERPRSNPCGISSAARGVDMTSPPSARAAARHC